MSGNFTCYAAEKLTYNNFEYSENADEITIEAYFGSEETVDIPAYILNKPVTSIADYAFLLCNTVKIINVLGSVTEIGEKAFSGASNIEKINIVADSAVDTDAFNNSTENGENNKRKDELSYENCSIFRCSRES